VGTATYCVNETPGLDGNAGAPCQRCMGCKMAEDFVTVPTGQCTYCSLGFKVRRTSCTLCVSGLQVSLFVLHCASQDCTCQRSYCLVSFRSVEPPVHYASQDGMCQCSYRTLRLWAARANVRTAWIGFVSRTTCTLCVSGLHVSGFVLLGTSCTLCVSDCTWLCSYRTSDVRPSRTYCTLCIS
jgi:hypothetical protein